MKKITEQDLQGKGVLGLPDTPGFSREQMQEKFEETARQVIVPAFNALVDELGGAQGASAIGIDPIDGFDAENVQAALGSVKHYVDEKIVATGAADMQSGVYDPTHKERDIFAYADEAANAVVGKTFVLTCTTTDTTHALNGLNGAEGLLTCAFTADADFVKGDTFTVDGTPYELKMQNGDEASDKLFVAGAKVNLIIDTEDATVNFKSGGGKKRLVTELIMADQDWTVPEGVTSINVRIFGGGGAGDSYGTNAYGGGGGGGHMEFGTFEVEPGTVYPVTIGRGGIAGGNNTTDRNGAPSSFGTLLSASGGAGGSGIYGNGGDGGSGGGGGNYSTSSSATGHGGNASYGGGGGGAANTYQYKTGGNGGTGGTYGGGGGGGTGWTDNQYSTYAGGNGGDGGEYGGGGGAGATSTASYAGNGGNGGTYGGGGGGKVGGVGGEYGGNGGVRSDGEAGIDTTAMTDLEFTGQGLAGLAYFSGSTFYGGGGGGGYGGNGGNGGGNAGYAGGGGGGYGGNGGNAKNGGGGGGGGYGGHGGNALVNSGGGGGGYGGNGGDGYSGSGGGGGGYFADGGNGAGYLGGGGGGYGAGGRGGNGYGNMNDHPGLHTINGGIAAGGGACGSSVKGGFGGHGICIIEYYG